MAELAYPVGQLDLTIVQGATFRYPMTYLDAANVIVPLEGRSAWLHIRRPVDAEIFLYSLTTAEGGIILANTAPNITLLIPAADTALLSPWDKAVYAFLVELGNGDRRRLFEGRAILSLSPVRGTLI